MAELNSLFDIEYAVVALLETYGLHFLLCRNIYHRRDVVLREWPRSYVE